MNLQINNTNFNARYIIHGKNTPQETDKVYGDKLDKVQKQKTLATQAQEYLAQDKQQGYISALPKDTFVRFNTGIVDGEGKLQDKILNFTPFISFETRNVNERKGIEEELGAQGDTLELSLNKDGKLDTERVDSWFENLIAYYNQKK